MIYFNFTFKFQILSFLYFQKNQTRAVETLTLTGQKSLNKNLLKIFTLGYNCLEETKTCHAR